MAVGGAGWFLLLFSPWAAGSRRVLMWSPLCAHVSLASLPLLTRTPFTSDQGPNLRISVNFNDLSKGPIASHWRGRGFQHVNWGQRASMSVLTAVCSFLSLHQR